MPWEQEVKEIESIGGDRRHDRRYHLQLELRWKLIRRKRVLDSGTGRTLDLSSGGIYLETERALHPGLNVELSISWPVMLHNVAPLQLVVFGKILRVNGNRSAILMSQHEFRTAASPNAQRPSLAAAAARGAMPFMFRGEGVSLGKR